MKALRDYIDNWYLRNRDKIFERTKDDPKVAHEKLVRLAKTIHYFRLEKLLLDCPENRLNPGFEISNAAGFNKDGYIHPEIFRYSGFDRVVIGTFTGDSWSGNPRPSIVRYVDTESLVNWEGLPGEGAQRVANTIRHYSKNSIPVTINLMSTPGKTGQEILEDIDKTLRLTNRLQFDRYELNISCPNTHSSTGKIDARSEYQDNLAEMLQLINFTREKRELWLKVSPNLDRSTARSILEVAKDYEVNGFTTANTSTEHDPEFITHKPNLEGKGGASGNAVWKDSIKVQRIFCEELDKMGYDARIIACGGINSVQRAKERLELGSGRVIGVQLYTPLIFKGPKLLRELRAA